jgi:pyruvate/2-oxoglutarate dehydrogenase complex dihydrolipoamide acyltransferase (E2) component
MNFPSPVQARLLLVSALAVLGALTTGLTAARAQATEPAYAVLIVGDEGDAEMLRVEKVLINEMAKRIRGDSDAEKLPIYSYHFNKERERAYCENKLNVLAEDLLFVGVVTLDNKVPLKVVYRIDRIVNSPRAAKDVLERAEELMGGTPAVLPSPSPSASPSAPSTPKPPANSGTEEEGFRVQLGSFTLKNYADDRKADAEKAGFEVVIVETTGPDGDVIYKVLSPTLKVRSQADEQLAKFKAAGFDQAFLVRTTK